MKQLLLSISVLASVQSFAQFTQTNEPAIGDNGTMYVLDSAATNMASTTGTGVTWDYSSTIGYYGETKNLACVAPSSTPYATHFAIASKAVDITGFVTSFFSSSSTARNSKGFVFDGGSLAGTVEVVLDANDELIMNYPMIVGDNIADAMSGTVYTTSMGSFPCTGSSTATCDGSGTLILNSTTSLTGVMRFKLVDQVTATVPFIGTVTMDRVQYEYYDLANSRLPVFVHATLTITMAGTPTVQSIVLSSVAPDNYLTVSEASQVEFAMFPNPANDNITLQGLTGNETIQILDVTGRVVLTSTAANTSALINVSELKAGVYNVLVNQNGNIGVKTLVIK